METAQKTATKKTTQKTKLPKIDYKQLPLGEVLDYYKYYKAQIGIIEDTLKVNLSGLYPSAAQEPPFMHNYPQIPQQVPYVQPGLAPNSYTQPSTYNQFQQPPLAPGVIVRKLQTPTQMPVIVPSGVDVNNEQIIVGAVEPQPEVYDNLNSNPEDTLGDIRNLLGS